MTQISTTIGDQEAGAHFAELLERVEAGEKVMITRNGAAVAKLVPLRRKSTPEERAAAIEAMKQASAGRTLGGLKIKDLINEGRP
jgi:prevent-host-death family protein